MVNHHQLSDDALMKFSSSFWLTFVSTTFDKTTYKNYKWSERIQESI